MSSFFRKKNDTKIIKKKPEKPDESINELSKKIEERKYFPEDSEEGKKFISRRRSAWGNNPDMDKSPWLQTERKKKENKIDNDEMIEIKEKMGDSDKFYYDLINALPYVQGNIKMLNQKMNPLEEQCKRITSYSDKYKCEEESGLKEMERKLRKLQSMEENINKLLTIYKQPPEGGRRKSRKHKKTKGIRTRQRRTRQRRTKTKSRQRKSKRRKSAKRR